jgi:hypothetical protein
MHVSADASAVALEMAVPRIVVFGTEFISVPDWHTEALMCMRELVQ